MDSPFKRSRHPVLLGFFVAVIALGSAVVAAAAWAAFSDGDKPEPDEVIRFDDEDADPLVGADVTGEAAPTEQYLTLEGTPATLADYRGKPVVLNFFGSWCVPCKAEMPAFEAVHDE